eukprot:SAG11_NODE_22798_length_400_cov_0.601329_1_plen_41_part_00
MLYGIYTNGVRYTMDVHVVAPRPTTEQMPIVDVEFTVVRD